MKEEVKVSVIVPVYNSEKYLDKCIQSILNQTYTNFELLLINDGSKDDSGVICDKYAVQDARVRVFHQENGGVSSARNKGLDNATGEWICFVDSDDWVEDSYLSFFVDKLGNTSDKTFIVQDLKILKDNKVEKKNDFKLSQVGINNFSEAFTTNKIHKNGYAVCKLYNRSLLNYKEIRFNTKMSYAEDFIFMMQYLHYVDSICFYNIHNYNYFLENDFSLSKKYADFCSELYLYNEIKSNYKTLSLKKEFNKEVDLFFYTTYLNNFLWRVLCSQYRPNGNGHINRKLRINRIKGISTDNKDYLYNYPIKYNKGILNLSILLFNRGYIKLFDLTQWLLFKIRYNKLF